MNSNNHVNQFIEQKNIAVFGVSRKKEKFGNYAYKELKKKGYRVFPINPNLAEIEGDKCFSDLASIPENVDAAFVNVKEENTLTLAKEIIGSGIKHIWFQQGTGSEKAIAYCRENGVEPVTGKCILMYAQPVESFHAFHRWLWKIFGKLKA